MDILESLRRSQERRAALNYTLTDADFESTVWFSVPRAPRMELGDCWEVRERAKDGSAFYRRIPITTEKTAGYQRYTENGDRPRGLHEFVAEIIHGPKPDGELVRHLDDDRANNFPSNLAYGTQADNIADAIRNGTFQRGERNGRAVLTAQKVRNIRRRAGAGESPTAIARRYHVSVRTITKIINRENWAHVA